MAELPAHPPEWIASAPLQNVQVRRVAASCDAVWARLADHESWPEWFTALKQVRVSGEPAGVGGRRDVTMSGVTSSEVFTAWEPGVHFAFAVVRGSRTLAGMAESVELRPDGDGCVITYRQGVEPARGYGLPWKVFLVIMRRELSKALEQLAERVEER